MLTLRATRTSIARPLSRFISSEAKAPASLASAFPSIPISTAAVALTTSPARVETSAFAPYEWQDPLKAESTLINEEERSIMCVDCFGPYLTVAFLSQEASR